jgi:hypothetical protein
MAEKGKIFKDFLTEYLMGFGSARGCALLGKTDFDKLKVVRDFLSGQGLGEFDGKGEASGKFIVIDCPEEARDADSVTQAAKRYRNVSYVIFNNCGDILCQDDVLKVFAHLLDADEYDIWFPTVSFFVFLGDKNTIPQKAGYPPGSWESDHIDSFCAYIKCRDFDKNKRLNGIF